MTVGEGSDRSLTHHIARFVDALDEVDATGIIDIVPSYTTVLVIYDSAVNNEATLRPVLESLWTGSGGGQTGPVFKTVVIPVVYGDEFGEDLMEVAAHHDLPVEEVIRRHQEGQYTVGALGFSPGFSYLIGLDPGLATPRRSTPRIRVPAGSVGIGGGQTGIYSLPTPGGWNLIGRTPMRLFDPAGDTPFPVQMGDEVRFERISPDEFRSCHNDEGLEDDPAAGVIEVISPGMQTTVQDPGRHGYARFGFAPNGAADRASLTMGNRAVGNPDEAAGLEVTLAGPSLRFHRRTEIVVTGANLGAMLNGLPLLPGRPQGVMPGDQLVFRASRPGAGARAYLAVAGGVDVPLVMGSRSTDLTAGIGGYRGRALRSGDRLAIGTLRRSGPAGSIAATRMDLPHVFDLVPGPQADHFDDRAWETLLSRSFTVSPASNRVGLRLDGATIRPRDTADIISEGIVTGAMQVTGEGQPIVMLPGHATIGGYTKIGTVIEEDLDRLGQLRPGDELRFTCRYRTS